MNLSGGLTSVVNKVGRGTSSENKDNYSLVGNIRYYSVFVNERTQISQEEGLQDTYFISSSFNHNYHSKGTALVNCHFERAHF